MVSEMVLVGIWFNYYTKVVWVRILLYLPIPKGKKKRMIPTYLFLYVPTFLFLYVPIYL